MNRPAHFERYQSRLEATNGRGGATAREEELEDRRRRAECIPRGVSTSPRTIDQYILALMMLERHVRHSDGCKSRRRIKSTRGQQASLN